MLSRAVEFMWANAACRPQPLCTFVAARRGHAYLLHKVPQSHASRSTTCTQPEIDLTSTNCLYPQSAQNL